jgi:CBS domain-containing protein
MRIHDLMKRDVITCSPQTRLDEAVALMWRKDCGFLPVVERDVVVGVLTDRDVAVCAWRHGLPLAQLRAVEAMTVAPVVVSDDERIERVEELMSERQVHRLPVVDAAGRLLGVISLGDMASAPRRGAGSSHRDDVVSTLSALSRRRPPSC